MKEKVGEKPKDLFVILLSITLFGVFKKKVKR